MAIQFRLYKYHQISVYIDIIPMHCVNSVREYNTQLIISDL